MKNLNRILVIISMLCQCILMQNAASEPLKMPAIQAYPNPKALYKSDPYKKVASPIPWKIFSNRKGVRLWNDERLRKTAKKVVNFLDLFYVFKKNKNIIQISPNESNNPRYWGKMEDFIIMNQPIKDENTYISHKIFMVNKIQSTLDTQNYSNTLFPLDAPSENAKQVSHSIKNLDFGYIYGYFPPNVNDKDIKHILLGSRILFEIPTLSSNKRIRPNSIKSVIKGWIPVKQVTRWKTREGLEPNPERKHPIYFFQKREDMNNYYRNIYKDFGSPKPNNKLLTATADWDIINRGPWPAYEPRYLIIEEYGNENSVLIKIIGSKLNFKTVETISNLRDKLKNIDLMFVIDATRSMSPYIKSVVNIADEIMGKIKNVKFDSKENINGWLNSFRVAAAVYRDYEDKDDKYDSIGFTTELSDVTSWLNNISCTSKSNYINDSKNKMLDAYYREAVFQGLQKAIVNSEWKSGHSHVIIHIGDTGNHSRLNDDLTSKDIGKLLATEYDTIISYMAIHVRSNAIDYSNNVIEKKAVDDFLVDTNNICKYARENWLKLLPKDSKSLSIKDKSLWYTTEVITPKNAATEVKRIIDEVINKIAYKQQLIEKILMSGESNSNDTKFIYGSDELWAPAINAELQKLLKNALGEKLNLEKKEIRFTQKAFVKMRIHNSDEKQFIKSVMLRKFDVKYLLIPAIAKLEFFGWSVTNPQALYSIFIQMIEFLTGELEPSLKKGFDHYYKMALGINFINSHELLRIPLTKIQDGMINIETIDSLTTHLKETFYELNQILDDETRWFKTLSGEEYCWFKESELP